MFGHRGIWRAGYKAVAFHAPESDFDDDQWELYQLEKDFAENHNLAADQRSTLQTLKNLWWQQARDNQVLPLDDRFGPRFIDNAKRYHGNRRHFVFHAGMGHLPSNVAPDVRSCNYTIEADVLLANGSSDNGVLIAHGDSTCGYSLYLQDGILCHDINIGGHHQILRAPHPVGPGRHKLGYQMTVGPMHQTPPMGILGRVVKPTSRTGSLSIDGSQVASAEQPFGFVTLSSWSGLDIGLDIGRDRGNPVSNYQSPFEFSGKLYAVRMTLQQPEQLDGDAIGQAEMARE